MRGRLSGSLTDALTAALGSRPVEASAVSGGDINQAHRVRLEDGREVFVKTNDDAPPGMFAAEARGLAWLEAPGVIRIPEVLAVSSEADVPQFLALEFLSPARPCAGFDETLGRALAELHRSGAPSFGLDHDNFIGRLPQSNASSADWPSFYRERRLQAQLRLARDQGRASLGLRQRFERLFARLSELLGPEEPAARLHGDLWGGNLHRDGAGRPALIDPAVYGGHREVDLAMMRLFGGFSERVFDAYHEAYPLAPGHGQRVALYQLYPLMVHVNLFGGAYVQSVERALASYC